LNLLISPVPLRATVTSSSPLLSMTAGWPGKFDGDGLACMGHADLDALAGDLDAAAAGHLPLDGQARSREHDLQQQGRTTARTHGRKLTATVTATTAVISILTQP
jgi:hypothetical protein